jgi:predicted dienelactone hydrolase
MHASKFLCACVACLASAHAQAAGFRFIDVPADTDGPALAAAMWYPCSEPRGKIDLGDITLPGVKDCPMSGDRMPLVVFSPGNGGGWSDQHDTAETLADAGFIVAAIEHPGDEAHSDDLAKFVERPTDIKRLIDFMVGASAASSKIDRERIGFFGFSLGGYTGLVLIGADPDWAFLLCRRSLNRATCEQILRKEFRAQPLTHDLRIKAAVIADPPGFYLSADSLAAVKVPVQLWGSEHGTEPQKNSPDRGVTPESVAAVHRNLPATHEYHVVPNSRHLDFLICPPALANKPICKDAPGFDRVAFHKQFNAGVLAFFRIRLDLGTR